MWTPRIQSHNPNGISIGSAVFAHMTAVSLYTLQWNATFPLIIAPSNEISGSHLIHGSLGPSESSTQMASQPFLQGWFVWQTDRPTDHATRSVTIDRIYVRSTAMRPFNNDTMFSHDVTRSWPRNPNNLLLLVAKPAAATLSYGQQPSAHLATNTFYTVPQKRPIFDLL